MNTWLQMVLTAVTSVLGASGFWAWMQRRTDAKSATTRLMMGIAYEHITTYGIAYMERGWITKDEYEEIEKYFYKPYKELGGNGFAERVMEGLKTLPVRAQNKYSNMFPNHDDERFFNNVRVVRNPNNAQAAAE